MLLFQAGKVTAVVTQNVDRLHHKAGSQNIIELHGTGYIVKCLKCPYEVSRSELQETLTKNNPDMTSNFDMVRPDGDVELSVVNHYFILTNLIIKINTIVCLMISPTLEKNSNIRSIT